MKWEIRVRSGDSQGALPLIVPPHTHTNLHTTLGCSEEHVFGIAAKNSTLPNSGLTPPERVQWGYIKAQLQSLPPQPLRNYPPAPPRTSRRNLPFLSLIRREQYIKASLLRRKKSATQLHAMHFPLLSRRTMGGNSKLLTHLHYPTDSSPERGGLMRRHRHNRLYLSGRAERRRRVGK